VLRFRAHGRGGPHPGRLRCARLCVMWSNPSPSRVRLVLTDNGHFFYQETLFFTGCFFGLGASVCVCVWGALCMCSLFGEHLCGAPAPTHTRRHAVLHWSSQSYLVDPASSHMLV
jgi:hypothetical protein